MKVQRHTGPQERIDLAFGFSFRSIRRRRPKHITRPENSGLTSPSRSTGSFLSISAHHDALAPGPPPACARSIPRYPRTGPRPPPSGWEFDDARVSRTARPMAARDLVSLPRRRSPHGPLQGRDDRHAWECGLKRTAASIGGRFWTFRLSQGLCSRQWPPDVAHAMDRVTVQFTRIEGVVRPRTKSLASGSSRPRHSSTRPDRPRGSAIWNWKRAVVVFIVDETAHTDKFFADYRPRPKSSFFIRPRHHRRILGIAEQALEVSVRVS